MNELLVASFRDQNDLFKTNYLINLFFIPNCGQYLDHLPGDLS